MVLSVTCQVLFELFNQQPTRTAVSPWKTLQGNRFPRLSQIPSQFPPKSGMTGPRKKGHAWYLPLSASSTKNRFTKFRPHHPSGWSPNFFTVNPSSLLGGELPTARKWVSSPQLQGINPTYPIYNWGYNPLTSRGQFATKYVLKSWAPKKETHLTVSVAPKTPVATCLPNTIYKLSTWHTSYIHILYT